MKYVYYKDNGLVVKITEEKLVGLNSLTVADDVFYNLKSKKETHFIYIKTDNSIKFVFNNTKKRDKTVIERDELLKETDEPYMYEDYLNSVLSDDERVDLFEYRDRLRNMPQHYDLSTDKEGWSYELVTVYTSGKNTNSYQLVKPSFIK